MKQIKITHATCVTADKRHTTALCITIDEVDLEYIRESYRMRNEADRILFIYEEINLNEHISKNIHIHN